MHQSVPAAPDPGAKHLVVKVDATIPQRLIEIVQHALAASIGQIDLGTGNFFVHSLAAWGLTDKPRLPALECAGRSLDDAVASTRVVVFEGVEQQVRVLHRDRLPIALTLEGPVLVDEGGSTTVVPPGWTVRLEETGCLVMHRN